MPSYRYYRTNDVVMVRTEVANGRRYGSDPRVWAMHYHTVVVVRTINAGVVVAVTGLVAAMVPAGAIATVVVVVVSTGAIAAVVVVVVPTGAIATVVVVVVSAGAIATIISTMVTVVVSAFVVVGTIASIIIVVAAVVTAVVAAAVVAGAIVAVIIVATVVTAAVVVIVVFLARIEGSAYAVAARLRCALVATVVAVGVDSGVISVGLGPVACFRAIGSNFAAVDGSGIGI